MDLTDNSSKRVVGIHVEDNITTTQFAELVKVQVREVDIAVDALGMLFVVWTGGWNWTNHNSNLVSKSANNQNPRFGNGHKAVLRPDKLTYKCLLMA